MAKLLGALLFCTALAVAVIVRGEESTRAGHDQKPREISRRHAKEYINSWAVKVRGGRKAADEVAQRNGFDNMGQVDAILIASMCRHF